MSRTFEPTFSTACVNLDATDWSTAGKMKIVSNGQLGSIILWHLKIEYRGSLFLETSKGNSGTSGCDRQWNEQKSRNRAGRKTNNGNFDVVGNQGEFSSTENGSTTEESRRANLKGTGEDGQKEGSTFDEERSNQVDHQLLVVCGKAQKSQFLGEGKKLLQLGQRKTVLFQFGEETSVNSGLEKVKLTNSADHIVLQFKRVVRKMSHRICHAIKESGWKILPKFLPCG
jgi:hypothetical protein